MKESIRAYVLEGSADSVTGRLREFPAENLPAGDVTIRVTYSSINFKDAMITAGVGKMIRKFPHIPGVDLAGGVVSDGTGKFKAGSKGLGTGYDLGVAWFGGDAAVAREAPGWGVAPPPG